MQLSFFNTINLKGEELKEAVIICNKQETRILEIMKYRGEMTPFEVSKLYDGFYDPVPITSIRRAMTVLTEKGKLEKLDEMKEGNYGKLNHKWRVRL